MSECAEEKLARVRKVLASWRTAERIGYPLIMHSEPHANLDYRLMSISICADELAEALGDETEERA